MKILSQHETVLFIDFAGWLQGLSDERLRALRTDAAKHNSLTPTKALRLTYIMREYKRRYGPGVHAPTIPPV